MSGEANSADTGSCARGIDARTEPTEEPPFEPGTFDAVFAGEIVEHLAEPHKALSVGYGPVAGSSSPLPTAAQVRFRCELVSLQHHGGGVEATLRDRRSSGTIVVSAHYAIAADGAHSRTRDALGLSLIGPDDLAEFHRVELSRRLRTFVEIAATGCT